MSSAMELQSFSMWNFDTWKNCLFIMYMFKKKKTNIPSLRVLRSLRSTFNHTNFHRFTRMKMHRPIRVSKRSFTSFIDEKLLLLDYDVKYFVVTNFFRPPRWQLPKFLVCSRVCRLLLFVSFFLICFIWMYYYFIFILIFPFGFAPRPRTAFFYRVRRRKHLYSLSFSVGRCV